MNRQQIHQRRARRSNAGLWCAKMRSDGYEQLWVKALSNGTLELVRNATEPPRFIHVVWVQKPHTASSLSQPEPCPASLKK